MIRSLLIAGLFAFVLCTKPDIFNNMIKSIDQTKFKIVTDILKFNTSDKNKIINGFPASITTFPFMVSFGFLTNHSYYHSCGGSIVNNLTVVSAKHCVDSFGRNFNFYDFYLQTGSFLIVLAGSERIDVFEFIKKAQNDEINLVTAINYDQDDVAILGMYSPFRFTSYVNLVTLPTNNPTVIFGKNVTAIGWGVTEFGVISPYLKSANLTVLNGNIFLENECQGFQDKNYCVKDLSSRGSNVCYGDSGGPLLYKINNEYVLYGVASFVFVNSNKTCINTRPSFFAMLPTSWALTLIKQ